MASSDNKYVAVLLQRYCEDSCTPEERAYIEGRPELLARVAAMRHDDAALRRLFFDAASHLPNADDRPSPQELIAYIDGTLTAAQRRFVEQYAERFPEIQAEIQLLRQLGRNPLLTE
jgi:anti-sigma factor RsiW